MVLSMTDWVAMIIIPVMAAAMINACPEFKASSDRRFLSLAFSHCSRKVS